MINCDFYIRKILNQYDIKLINKTLVINKPIKVEYFLKLKRYIFMNQIDVKEILVK